MEEQCSNGDLETRKADLAAWLMKFPPMASRSWLSHSASVSSRSFAKVVISVDPLLPDDDTSSSQFTLELTANESGNAPKRYSLDMSTGIIPLCVFSQTNQGKVSMEGKVLNKFDVRPHNENISDYGKLCRERTNKYVNRTRQVQVIDDDRGVHMRPLPGMVGLLASGSQYKKKTPPLKVSNTKKGRRDRGVMEQIMFKLFEKQPKWTMRQLIQGTDQSEHLLKDILKDLCIYNNKGANIGTYELKPEYKRSDKEAVP